MTDEPVNGEHRQPIVVPKFNRPKTREVLRSKEPAILNPNPIADDGLIEVPPPKRPVGRPRKVVNEPVNLVRQTGITTLLGLLADVLDMLPGMTYGECGELINALTKAVTDTSLARRQKQEQLEAGTHRSPCKTCGTMIDISKSGGYQIITERDEYHMPVNVYYCSTNCLLAKNMPNLREYERRKQKAIEKSSQ